MLDTFPAGPRPPGNFIYRLRGIIVVVERVRLIISPFFQPTMSKSPASHLVEDRIFQPSAEFSKAARVKSLAAYKKKYAESIKDAPGFWAAEASESPLR